ncbi:MAG: hypothetical protein AAGD14_09945 [Planctomycetota bacterium]
MRLLAVDITEASGGDYDTAFGQARDAGMDVVGLFLQWDVLEPTAGALDDTLLKIMNGYYPSTGVQLDLTIAVINANVKTVPPDLQASAFDDPAVIQRFRDLLDFVLDEIPDVRLHALNIGSEMDILFGDDAAQWAAFKTFYDAAVDHLKARDPSLVITVEPTYEGLMGSTSTLMRALNEKSDAIALSYYPRLANGDVAPPEDVGDDFDALVAAYPDLPIFFLQFGYPSSPLLNSSEAKQAEFVRASFRAWDRHADRIELIDFTWLHDLDPDEVQDVMEFYGFIDARFGAFLGTLGLRRFDGTEKPAFAALREEAARR